MNQRKIDTVKNFTEKVKKSKSIIFSDYRGLTVIQMQDLKRQLKKENGEYVVTKNTLLKRSLTEANLPLLEDSILEGPTATLFSYEDEISPLKILVAFAKNSGFVKIKAGFLDKIILTKEKLEELSSLPSRIVLLAKVVGTISAPTYGLVNVLQGNLRKLVYAIEAIKNSAKLKAQSANPS